MFEAIAIAWIFVSPAEISRESTISQRIFGALGGYKSGAPPQIEADLFVSPDGNDGSAGTLDAPLASIDHAMGLAEPGDTILVRGGLYAGPVKIWNGGGEGAPVTIKAYPGERPIIDGLGTAADTDLVSIFASHVHLEGFEIRRATRAGISVWSATDVTIIDNIVHDVVRCGIWIGSDRLGISTGHRIERNIIFNTVLENKAGTWSENWCRGIAVDVSTDTIVRANTVFKNYGEGIGSLSSRYIEYRDNIVYDNFSSNLYLDNSQHIVATGNIFFHTGDERFFRNGKPCVGLPIANEYTEFEMPTIGIVVRDNIFAGVKPGFYDDSHGWGGGIKDLVIGPNQYRSADEISPEWLYSGPFDGRSPD